MSADARAALRQLLGDHDRALASAFRDGAEAIALAQQRARLVEQLLARTWMAFLGESDDAALFAVGGFGRGALFPHSDVDLLVLVDDAQPLKTMRAIEALFACLWDIGIKPGHAVRTCAQCRELAAADVSVFTSLLDARRIGGASGFDAELQEIVADSALWPPDAYLLAKRADRDARHARHDDTTHNLEPNLKDGPGGLRSIDLIRWLGLRLADAPDFDELVRKRLLDPSERDALLESAQVLQCCRYALHLEAGRAEERLLFDWQRALAARLGYADDGHNLAVEQFMQMYYRAAGTVERLLTQLFERFVEHLHPLPPPRALDEQFTARGARLEPRDPTLFGREPATVLDAYVCLLDHPQLSGFSATSMHALVDALALHGDVMADDPEVLTAFRGLLQRGASAVRALDMMNRHGVLAAILPAFARVVGRMQYDLFHIYTVDEHTLRVLRNLARFAEPGARAAFPLACDAFARLEKPELLLLAALFHDIAKGRGGDHSELGEHEARTFCAKLGLRDDEIEWVAWLVRWHLLMSVTAQRQDTADADVVHRFAVQVGDWGRLDHLYLLTIADIAGTSPKLWNAWKDRLLADLYVAARYVLRGDLARPPQAQVRVRATRERVLTLLLQQGLDVSLLQRVLADFPDDAFLRQRTAQIAWQVAALVEARDEATTVAIRPHTPRGGTEVFVCAPDRDGVFAAVVAILDRARCNVVEARVMATHGGRALDVFTLLDAENLTPIAESSERDLRLALLRVLAPGAPRVPPPRRGLARHLKHFQRAPQIDFNDDTIASRTRLALVCSDRPGLLAHVAQAFLDCGVRVHDARIATFGERVEDFFEVTDRHDLPLDAARQDALRAALRRRLGNDAIEPTKETYARA